MLHCYADLSSSEGKSSAGFDLMQEIYINLNKANGASVIAAVPGDRDSYEPEELGNSIFMYYIIKGLNLSLADINGDGSIKVNELQ